jgi:protein TonB
MPDPIRPPARWAALAALATLHLVWPASGIAQAPTPAPAPSPAATSAAERAQREAERVFEFIKFHSLRPRTIEPARPARPPAPAPAPAPAAAPAAAPQATPAAPAPVASPERVAAPPRPAVTDAPAKPAATLPASEAPPALVPAPITVPEPVALPVVPNALPPVAPPPAPAATLPAPEADDDDEPLQLQSFVAPVLTPAVQATLGAGARSVKVRFTVEPDGRVSQAEAAATVPKRLAKPAVDAILQWRFTPLQQARTVDVEIAFRRD